MSNADLERRYPGAARFYAAVKNDGQIPTVELTPGYRISQVLKGGWQLAHGHGKPVTTSTAIRDMRSFHSAGVTTFDCADIYTGVEELIGTFLKEYELYGDTQIHTKFVPDLDKLGSITKSYVHEHITRSLNRLGVDMLDLVQFHWWDFDIPGYTQTAKFLSHLQQVGLVRHIGVTNFDVGHLQELIDERIAVISNQVQFSLLDNRPQNGMTEFCRTHNIKLLCYGTLAGGFLAESWLGAPDPGDNLENRSLVKYKLIISELGGWNVFQELLQTVASIAQKKGTSMSNVAIKYVLQQEQVAGVIVGARNIRHLENMGQLFSFTLDETDMSDIMQAHEKFSPLRGDVYELEREKTGRHASIMKYNLNE